MRGRPLHIDWQPEDTAEALHAAYRTEQDPALKPRLQALWLMRSGHRIVEAAAAVGFTYRTVQYWLDHYRKGGCSGLASTYRPPPPAEYLTAAQWELVRDHLRKGTTRTIDMLRRWMREQFEVEWSYVGLRKRRGKKGARSQPREGTHPLLASRRRAEYHSRDNTFRQFV